MTVRSSSAAWRGDLKSGSGMMRLGSGAFEGSYSFPSRFENGQGTNPEELVAASHAGCFSMAFAHGLSQAGHKPNRVATTANVHLDSVPGGFAITKIELVCEAEVPGLDPGEFKRLADEAKAGCPVSKALAGTKIELDAKLV